MANRFAINKESTLQVELSTARALCITLDTPVSLGVFLRIKYALWHDLVCMEIDSSNYLETQHFADDYLAVSILKKSSHLPLNIDTEQAAKDSFFESEANCKVFNDKFLQMRTPVDKRLSKVRFQVEKILGKLRSKDLRKVQSNFKFGPGASTGVRGHGSVKSDKYDAELHLTSELYPYYRAILGDTWWELQASPCVVEGSNFTTVPKNAKTDRGINVEPTLNMYVQLGIGHVIRDKLKHSGINLNSQQKNRDFAARAQRDRLATIDLSAASDSISFMIVSYLLPREWFRLLCLCRSEKVRVDGEFHSLEKFSAMGNGYTFELESLIFYAACLACVPESRYDDITVYGDDIIVPQEYTTEVIDTLELLGFKVNTEKSFLAGAFFESCGADWFNGQDVRPFYLRRDKDSNIPYTLQIANALRKYSRNRNNHNSCDPRFRDLWRALVKVTPAAWRKARVPIDLGDTGLLVSLSEANPPYAQYACTREEKLIPSDLPILEGYLVFPVKMNPVRVRKHTIGVLLNGLSRLPQHSSDLDLFSRGFEPRRGLFGQVVKHRVLAKSWDTGLDWG
jgi:hypothetical protein